MWKVIAADDENYIREALRNLISWEKMECTLISVCSNGRQLLEQIDEKHPDIVITDIRMPLADGLEVCKRVFEQYPETQVIILSAYSDFEYARTALRYDACEYVLKVAVLEELPQAVEKAVGNLKKRSREMEEHDIVRRTEMDTLYCRMQSYIEENYCKKITLDDIADALHANRSYLSRLYKSKRGINLFDDILSRRIDKAKEYMQTTDWKIYEISQAVGFDDTGYFSKVFRKFTGMSPKEYRNERKTGRN